MECDIFVVDWGILVFFIGEGIRVEGGGGGGGGFSKFLGGG